MKPVTVAEQLESRLPETENGYCSRLPQIVKLDETAVSDTLTPEVHHDPSDLGDFLTCHYLPPRYLDLARRWFLPLINELALQRRRAQRPLLIGINGSQGSGKTTLAALLRAIFESRFGLNTIDLSIDDFYLPRDQRLRLAEERHPLFDTRGVPGTHDMSLMRKTLDALLHGEGPVPIPGFDKALDDRVPEHRWQSVNAPLDMVILDGWCLGTPAQDEEELATPVNLLEANEDPEGEWRRYVNRQIIDHYQPLYDQIDIWVMLEAPSFDCVYRWRLEQEKKLADSLADSESSNRVMSPAELARFIQHYQRLTMHTLKTLPQRVHYLFELDAERNIHAATRPNKVELA
jgi:D-glycerate 3-kinase